MQDNGMNHPNWDRAEREHLEYRAGLNEEDKEGGACVSCGEFVFEDEDCEKCKESEEDE